jgi:hypothetical protein
MRHAQERFVAGYGDTVGASLLAILYVIENSARLFGIEQTSPQS